MRINNEATLRAPSLNPGVVAGSVRTIFHRQGSRWIPRQPDRWKLPGGPIRPMDSPALTNAFGKTSVVAAGRS